MIVHSTFSRRVLFFHMQKFVFSSSGGSRTIKNFHCASVMNAEDDIEPRLTLKQIERKKLEKRSKYKKDN